MSGQVWGHTPEQRVAPPPLLWYSFSLRVAIAQTPDRSHPYPSNKPPPAVTTKHAGVLSGSGYGGLKVFLQSSGSVRSRPVGVVQHFGSRQDRMRWVGSSVGNRVTCL